MTDPRPLGTAWVVLVVVVGLVVGPALVAPTATGECAAAADEVRVSVVIDAGDTGPSQVCVAVAAGSTGADVLVERSRRLGTPPPRWDGSGLLCAIDGHPETGCGERTSDGYRYWSYWSGDTGTWSYSPIGPATRRMTPGSVEGWHFVEGAGNPTDPPPRAAATHAGVCGDAPTTTRPPAPGPATTTPPAPAPGPVATTAPTAGDGSAAPGATAPSSGGAAPGAPGAGATTGTGAPAGSPPPTSDDGGPGDAAARTAGAAAPGSAPSEGSRSDRGGSGAEQAAGLPAAASAAPDTGGGLPASTVVGLVLVAALGGGAALRSRRLRATR